MSNSAWIDAAKYMISVFQIFISVAFWLLKNLLSTISRTIFAGQFQFLYFWSQIRSRSKWRSLRQASNANQQGNSTNWNSITFLEVAPLPNTKFQKMIASLEKSTISTLLLFYSSVSGFFVKTNSLWMKNGRSSRRIIRMPSSKLWISYASLKNEYEFEGKKNLKR